MWSLIKSLLLIACVGAVAYFVFFVPVGGATMADHGRDIWRSNIVQQRVQKVRSSVHDELAERLGQPLPERGGRNSPAARKAAEDDIREADRKALDTLLANSLK